MQTTRTRHPTALPWRCRTGDGGDDESDGGGVELDTVDERSIGEDDVKILCGACGHQLAEGSSKTDPDGAHRHVKVNPHGHVFHIACFHPVPGADAIGKPSAEFSWFSGYRWQIALCGECGVHLGWKFSGDGAFTALIEGRYTEEADS